MGNGPARVLVTELRTAQTATPLDVRAGAEIPGVEVCPERSWLPPTPRLPEPPLPTAPPDLEMPPTPEREGLVLHPQPSLSAAERPRPRPPQEHPRPPSSSPPSAAPAAPRPTPLELVYAPRVADFYPRAAERRGLGGVVLVGLEVDAWGAVSRAWVIASSGHVILDRAALRLVQAYRFNTASGTRRAHQRVIFTP
ncbi:MAG: TonB family protein [Planctomycetota bacterium]|jgi:protein TonB